MKDNETATKFWKMESKQKSSECVLVIPKLNPKPAEEGNQEAANLFPLLAQV